jgi:hypothetical protein
VERASKLGGDTLRDDGPFGFDDTVVDNAESPQAEPKSRAGDATIVLGSRTGELEGEAQVNTQRSRESTAPKKSEPESEPEHEHEHPHEEKFFSEGDLVAKVPEAAGSEESLTVADTVKRRAAPEVVERRARFIGYVKWAIGGALVVCLAAAGRAALSSKAGAAASPPRAAIQAEEPPAPKAAEISPEPASPPAPSAEPPAAAVESVAAVESAAPAPSAAPAESGSVSAPPAPPPGDGKTAKEEKLEAQKLLEGRKIDLAIGAGERSVALDPTDGEAWLILGAAYQEKGRLADARKAYASCVKDGKSGPRNECMKMLR